MDFEGLQAVQPGPLFWQPMSTLYPTFSNISKTLDRPSPLSCHWCSHESSNNLEPSALGVNTRLKRLSIAFSLKTGGGVDATENSESSSSLLLTPPRPLPIEEPFPRSLAGTPGWDGGAEGSGCSGCSGTLGVPHSPLKTLSFSVDSSSLGAGGRSAGTVSDSSMESVCPAWVSSIVSGGNRGLLSTWASGNNSLLRLWSAGSCFTSYLTKAEWICLAASRWSKGALMPNVMGSTPAGYLFWTADFRKAFSAEPQQDKHREKNHALETKNPHLIHKKDL